MNITEDTRIKSGTIKHNGHQLLYTMIINPASQVCDTVDLIIHAKGGIIIDTMQRSYSRLQYEFRVDVVKAALAEFKEDRA